MRLTEVVIGASLSRAAPPRRSPAWQSVRSSLERAGVPAGAVRSWQALFSTLHRRAPPRSASLAVVLGDFTLSDLLSSISSRSAVAGLPSVACWNVRWLVNPQAAGNSDTCRVIVQHLEKGRPCLLQETHWDEAAAAVWAAALPATSTVASPALTAKAMQIR